MLEILAVTVTVGVVYLLGLNAGKQLGELKNRRELEKIVAGLDIKNSVETNAKPSDKKLTRPNPGDPKEAALPKITPQKKEKAVNKVTKKSESSKKNS